jgi:outer membrane protein
MKFGERFSSLARAGLTLVLVGPAGAALADETSEPERKRWQVTVGAGVASLPEYPGSGNEETRALPIVNVRYGRFFLGGVPGGSGVGGGLGAFLYEDASWSFGAIVSGDFDDPRRERDDARLRGLGDVDGTVRAGVFASYRPLSWLSLSTSALSDVGGNGQGIVASFDAQATYRPFPRLGLSAGPGVVWASDEYSRTFFGVDADQAARSGFARYDAGGGANLVRFSVGAQYELTRQWSLGSRITAARLQGDAADSPIVEDKNQNTYALFVTYRF